MKLPNYLTLSLLIHCLIINSTDSKCLESHPCGKHTLKFPLTDIHHPKCGLFVVHGCGGEHQMIELEAGGVPYHLLRVSVSERSMTIGDYELRKLLKERSNFALGNVSLFKSPFASLALASPDLAPFSCKRKVPEIHEFTLEWNVSRDCDHCHRRGGQCFGNSADDFYCREGGRSRLMLIIAISVGGLLFLLCLLISYMIWLLRKRISTGYVRSSNVSFVASKSDISGASSFFGIPIFHYTELEAATNNFDPSRELGDGGFGTVYYGRLLDGREVAIKRLYEQNCRRVEQFMNEIKILTCLRHPNLVCLYGCTSRRSRELLLVYEYVSNGTVAEHLHGERGEAAPLSWPIRMRIAVETATALAYLHKSDIIHRDVKTDNILLDGNFHVKVADFGLSRLFPNDATHISTVPGGTPGYIDPDYHMCYQVTDKSDVYSYGVVLIELVSSMPAVDVSRQTNEINLANWALTRIQRGAFNELMDPSLGYNVDARVTEMATSVAEIAFRCLQLEKDMRPSMAEVLAFLRDISN